MIYMRSNGFLCWINQKNVGTYTLFTLRSVSGGNDHVTSTASPSCSEFRFMCPLAATITAYASVALNKYFILCVHVSCQYYNDTVLL